MIAEELDKTMAWKIKEKNADVLSIISGKPKATFKANVGWVLVRDHGEFFLIPQSVFNRLYPTIYLIITED
jgi:hypothetical protein